MEWKRQRLLISSQLWKNSRVWKQTSPFARPQLLLSRVEVGGDWRWQECRCTTADWLDTTSQPHHYKVPTTTTLPPPLLHGFTYGREYVGFSFLSNSGPISKPTTPHRMTLERPINMKVSNVLRQWSSLQLVALKLARVQLYEMEHPSPLILTQLLVNFILFTFFTLSSRSTSLLPHIWNLKIWHARKSRGF